jgi:hypothetical protein
MGTARMTKLLSKDRLCFLLLAVSIGIGLGGTYGSENGQPVVGMAVGVVVCIIASELLQRLFLVPESKESSPAADARGTTPRR